MFTLTEIVITQSTLSGLAVLASLFAIFKLSKISKTIKTHKKLYKMPTLLDAQLAAEQICGVYAPDLFFASKSSYMALGFRNQILSTASMLDENSHEEVMTVLLYLDKYIDTEDKEKSC